MIHCYTVAVALMTGYTATQTVLPKAERKVDPKVQALLERATTAHGGNALKKINTFHLTSEMHGSGPFGMRTPNQQCDIFLDVNAKSGRWQMSEDGKPLGIYQQTPKEVSLWTKKSGTQKLREPESPFSFTPIMNTGVFGLIALQSTQDALTFVEKGEIKGRKGQMIVRTQVAQETLIMAGKGELSRDACQTTWAYLFAPDGTLIAERITQTQPKRVIETEVSYDHLEVYKGIKIPTEISVKSNQIPRMVSLKQKVKQVAVNDPLPPSTFLLP